MKKTVMNIKTFMMSCMLMCATASLAANGVWNGTGDALWTNSANWSASPYPSGNDTASFTNAGNGQTTIDVAGLTSIKTITFDSPLVAAYTNGTGAVNSQTLILADSGVITLTDTAANSQLFNAGLQLGTTMAAGTYTITNANTSQTLTFNQVFGALSGGTAAGKTLVVNGAGNTSILGDLWRGGATSLTLTHNSSGTLMMSGSNTVLTLNMNGGTNSVVDIGNGFLALNNGGGTTLTSSQGGTINGNGTLWLSGAAGAYADNSVAAGKTLVINPSITSPAGFELYGNTGTFVLNATNTFAMDVTLNMAGAISVWNVGNKGSTTSNLGKGNNIIFNANATPGGKLIYTGTGEESDRTLIINYNAILDQSGTGLLKFTAPLTASGNTKTLTLQGSTSGIGEIAGVIPNAAGTSLAKEGSGTWILSAANTYNVATTINGGKLILAGTNGAINASSGYTVNPGATLLLENASDANNTNRLSNTSTVTLNGGTLSITNNGGAVNYGENAGTLAITSGGNSTIATTEAIVGQTNTLTFTALTYSGGKINFTGTGLGESDRNRIFITSATNGLMGAWATVNGTSYAAYNSTSGVYAATSETVFTDIAAEGGLDPESIIPDNGALWARINLPGVSGPITLQGEWTNSIGYVIQNTTTNTTIATFDGVTNKLLRAAGLSIAENKNELKVGVSENDGYLSPLTAGGTLVLENNSTGNELIVNAAIVNNTSMSALSKIGAGAVVLNGTNTYTGNTSITEGILTFGGNSAQTVLGTTTIANGTLAFAGNAVQTVAAAISGAGKVVKDGNSTLNLNTANTFTGGLTINQGTVATAQANGLSTGPVTNNSTLNLTGGAQTYSGLSIGLAGSGTNNVTLGIGSTATAILNGDYSNFTGVWNIGIGRVAGQSKAQMNGLDNSAATINILSNATLYSVGAVTHNAALVLEGGNTYESLGQLRLDTGASWAGPITLTGPITDPADSFFGNGNNSIISGVIDDLGSGFTVDKLSAGTLTFSGANTYSGPTWVKAGALSVPAMGSISGGASPLGSQTSAEAGKVRLGNAAAGTLIYTGTGETTDRMIDMAGTTFGATLDQSGTGHLNLTGGMMISGTGNKTLILQGSTSGTGEFAGAITNGAGSTISVTKAGTNTWTLSGANAYTGPTTISAGTLKLTGSITNSAVTMSGGVFDVSGTVGNGNVTINAGTGAKVIARSATALGTGQITLGTGATTPFLEFKIDGGGTIALPNTFVGNSGIIDTIDVNNNGTGTGGVIQFNGLTNRFANSTLNVTGANGYSLYFANLRETAGSGGTMTLNPTTAALGIGELSGHFSSANSYIVVLDGTHPSNTITGVISDKTDTGNTTITITKTNSSTWTLTGVSTYTGPTAVNGGTLLVNAPGSLGAGSAVTVNKGGILGGSGTINGAVTANAGGRLAPGGIGTIATFNLSSSLTLNGGTLAFDISNVSTDKVAVAGALVVNSTSLVDLGLLGGSLAEGTYTLMTYASKSGSGTFALASGYPNATVTAGATSLVLTVGAGGTGYGLTWKGNISSNWDGTDLNWDIDGVAATFAAGNLVTFNDTAANFTVTSLGAVLPNYVAFNNANNYMVSANIDGTAPFVKLGTGTTTLTGLTTFNPASIVLNEGILILSGTSLLNNGLYAGEIINNTLLNYVSSSTQTNSGTMSGLGSLIQSGSGTLILAGSNAFNGTVTVNAGSVLKAQHAYALGTVAGGTTVAAGGALELAGDITTIAEPLTLSGMLSSQTGTNTYGGLVTIPVAGSSINVGAGSMLSLKNTQANGAYTKEGLGWLKLTADPNGTGVMTINNGVAELAQATGSTESDIIINANGILLASIVNPINDVNKVTVNAGGLYDLRQSDTIASLNGAGLVTKGTTGAATLTVGGNNASGAFPGVIENGFGMLGLTKGGTGTQTLSGVNTYTGLTSVTGGTLLIDGSTATNSAVTANNTGLLGGTGMIYGPVNMASGSTLLPGGPNAIGTLTLANDSATSLTLNGATLRCDLSNVPGNCDLVAIAGASGTLVLNGVNLIQLNFLNGSAPVGDYTLMTFNSYTGLGSFALASSYPNATLELTASSLVLHVVGGSASNGLVWKGNISGIWDGGILNWTNGTASVAYTPGAAVTFDDTATGNLIVSSGGAVSPASVFYNNSTKVYTNAANMTGTGPLVKLGSNPLTLSGITTYNPAFIEISSSAFTLIGASKLNNGDYAGPINNNGTFTTISSAAQTLSGVLSGAGSLVKDSASTLILSGTNTYTGATTVRGGGILKIQNNTALGTTASGTTVTNATLELAGDIITPAEALNLYGVLSSQTGTNTYAGNVQLRTGSSVNVGASSILIITSKTQDVGASPFSKTGAGLLRLTNDPDHKGICTVAGGTLELTGTGSTDADFIINSGATLRETTANLGDYRLTNNGTFDLRISDQIGGLDGSGVVTIGNTSAYTLTVGAGSGNPSGSFSGVLQNGSGTLSFIKTGTGSQTLSGVNTFTGNMNLTGTVLLTGAGQFGGGFYAGTIANATMFVHDSSANQILNGVISGAGQLRKTGTGKLTLGAVNTYSGATAISNGVLRAVVGGSCASSAITLAAATGKSASLEVGVTDTTKQWTCASLTVNNAGSGMSIDFGDLQPSTTLPPLKITGALTLTSAPVLTIKGGGFLPVTTGNGYPLMTWGSGSAASMTTVVLPGRVTGSVVVIGTTNYLQITSNNQPLVWASSGAGTWNTNTINTVWQDLVGSITAYSEATLPGDQVVFSDSNLVADTTVTLNTTVTPARVTVTNDAYSYTISGSGVIAGETKLIKSGTNTVTLATANTFTGLTTLNNGTLKLANPTALPAGNNLAMAGKGVLDMNGNATALTNITASTAANTIFDTSAGAGTTPLSIRNQTTTIAATIKDGSSKSVAVSIANNNASFSSFSTTSSNTYSGGLTLKQTAGAGTRLRIMTPVSTDGAPGNIISSPFGTGPITIGEAVTDKAQILFDTVANNTVANEIVVNSTNGTDMIYAIRTETTGNTLSGKVTANSDLTFGSNGTGSIALTNEISGAGGLRLVTSATLLTVNLFGLNTYSGQTILREGTLAFNSIGNVGSGPSALGAPTTVGAGTIRVGNGAKTGMTLLYRGMGHTSDRVIELAGTTGGLTINHSGTNLLKFTSDLLMSGSGAKRFALNGANNSTGEVAGVIANSPVGVVDVYKTGINSTWRLSGANTFTGPVEIDMGTLIVTHSSSLGLGNKTVKMTNGTAGNPQLHLDGSAGPITLGTNLTYQTSNNSSGSFHNIQGTNTIEGNVTMTGGGGDTWLVSWADKLYMRGNISPNTTIRQLRLRGNGDGEISGVIANGSTVNMPVLREVGTGTWTLSGTNTYSGATTINSGTVAAGNDQAFGTGVVNLTGGNLGGAIGTWSVTNTVNVQNNAAIDTLGILILTGAVTNNAALNKIGAGTLLLNGSKTGTGALTVTTGVLGGIGTISGTVTNQATITAADTNSIGTLTVANLTLASNSTLFWNCNAVTQDVINVTGTLTLPAVATVIVSEETLGDIGPTPRVLFTFATGPAPAFLADWVIVGAPQGTVARVSNNQVYLFRTGGTMISIF